MRRIFDSILSLKAKINKLFHYEALNSHNKMVNNYYGTVNFIGKQDKDISKRINLKINYLSSTISNKKGKKKE
ncbi:hypothetical protein A3A93_00475 [Candidatus Roizmanbacteria bacterium RIFCSPLOWO2_01_FULL_38_12]|uniref:Uncharacterized protein n=1 Tax=Candidatus Roizmanbacteria bacterium RIFCSPLOWO2_01_FULL_38_12 TaxID=1802061 RepID=A0A1F7IR13_9BACT|nr:MAG: hypothetical protein A2861_03200 [Candidatus Roizmanbacteria bacterium RIFCSPHIGHO2_01_FULL_38_15]OGK34660.1 MAG: hypothetical protein A3F59_06505 [Candidatus Roizmanbacteria bacterium RIFCSPHIGHO2_12_FULL_38_13]OGK45799.1 MAG: hypothetical protein A3A93_00475 [Candidatus Roizmanbacteria bacterium RIFCSPLOWO2_01_FULL_38_12]